MTNEYRMLPTIEKFYNKIINEDFVIDKTGVKTVEILNYSVELDTSQATLNFNEIRKTPIKYVQQELDWYLSQDLSVKEIGKHASIWNKVANENGLINSNYGYLIWSQENYNQYDNVLMELMTNKESRRAAMIYNRPLIWNDYNSNGMDDFICTYATQHLIRNSKLISIVYMRSNDFIYGFFNDFFWQCKVHEFLYKDLVNKYKDLYSGEIYWNVASMHVYERHFDLIKKIHKSYNDWR